MGFVEEQKNILTEIESLKKQFTESASKIIQSEIEKLFDKYPELDKIGWEQFTIYFNDGDVCTFSAHLDYPFINDIHYGYDEERLEWSKSCVNDFRNIFKDIPDEYLENIYGDHQKVFFYRGVSEAETISYTDHD